MPNLKRKRVDNNGSDDDEPSFGKQILPVANLPATFDGIPNDGMEYLFTVRRDALSRPHVTRVENPYQVQEPVLPPPRSLEVTHPSIPSVEWRSLFEIRFRNLKKAKHGATYRYNRVDQQDAKIYGWGMRAFDDDSASLNYNATSTGEDQVGSPSTELSSPSGHPDKARADSASTGQALYYQHHLLLEQMDERMALHLLMYFTYWINQHLQQDRQATLSSTHTSSLSMDLCLADSSRRTHIC
ncbi:hypothetical protein BT96DRAFT_984445 [Gymnopus androsaceus JB14]|uniref:Uncharacterized protein n=1 Tax=Gymnopus androsaceus JB14 TaxID=1447944 RepID=A0A6A4ID61_9AGAR|nr:hypothetical protein BT96DRAFT_984445 [Gymnopus androsaceus JB14]